MQLKAVATEVEVKICKAQSTTNRVFNMERTLEKKTYRENFNLFPAGFSIGETARSRFDDKSQTDFVPRLLNNHGGFYVIFIGVMPRAFWEEL